MTEGEIIRSIVVAGLALSALLSALVAIGACLVAGHWAEYERGGEHGQGEESGLE
jgi:hypothetical protein